MTGVTSASDFHVLVSSMDGQGSQKTCRVLVYSFAYGVVRSICEYCSTSVDESGTWEITIIYQENGLKKLGLVLAVVGSHFGAPFCPTLLSYRAQYNTVQYSNYS
jgi:hypothetical protein